MEIGKKKKSDWDKFKKVKFEISVIVPDDPEWIKEAETFLEEDVHAVVKYKEVQLWINEEDAPNATADDVPDYMLEFMDDQDD